ncbi:MAG: hypothetical protein KIT14_02350 [bacterium]|nr:hypothetical protein [bacterium]
MDASASRFQATLWLMVVAVALLAWVLGLPYAWGILVGGAAVGFSTAIWAASLQIILRGGRVRLAVGIVFVKVAAVLALGWLALYGGAYRPDPMGFAIGVSCLPIAVACEAIRMRKV